MNKLETLSQSPSEFSSPVEVVKLKEHPAPLIEQVIFTMKESGLNPDLDYFAYVNNSKNQILARSYLLSLACRQAGDQTGILGPLIGVCQSPKETKTILIQIGEILLQKADKQVLQVLEGKDILTTESALKIDDLLGEAVRSIRQVAVDKGLANPNLNSMTLSAYDFWLKNRLRLYALMKSQGINNVFDLLGREVKYEVNPRGEKYIVDITQQPILPKIDPQPLLEILPPELNRNINPELPPVDDPLGFLARLNMAGSDLFRYFAEIIRQRKQAEDLREKVFCLP